MASFRNQINHISCEVTERRTNQSEEAFNNNPNESSDGCFEFQFRVVQKSQLMANPINEPAFMIREDQNPAVHRSFYYNPCHTNNLYDFGQIVSPMLTELEIDQPVLKDALIYQICSKAMVFTKCACDMGRKTMTLQVEIEIIEVFMYDEEETISMALNESIEDAEARGYGLVPASKSAIDELEKVKFNGEGDIKSCCICLEEMEIGSVVSRMPCSHVFHGGCINPWLERNHLCPLCRYQMPI